MFERIGKVRTLLVVLLVLCALYFFSRHILHRLRIERVSIRIEQEIEQTQGDVKNKEQEQTQAVIHIPNDEELRNMAMIDLEDLYTRYIENIQEACGITQHMGGEIDGGYHVCEKYIVKNNCLVYSFGSQRMYEFEDEVVQTYGCEVHTFDPFDGQNDHQHSPKVTFHKLGLGNKDDGALLKLGTIKKNLKHSDRVLDILKIDIEMAEWDSLAEITASGELSRVKALIVEFHLCVGGMCTDTAFRTKASYSAKLATLRNIYDQGFRLYFFRMYKDCKWKDERGKLKTGCHEVHFMKSEL